MLMRLDHGVCCPGPWRMRPMWQFVHMASGGASGAVVSGGGIRGAINENETDRDWSCSCSPVTARSSLQEHQATRARRILFRRSDSHRIVSEAYNGLRIVV